MSGRSSASGSFGALLAVIVVACGGTVTNVGDGGTDGGGGAGGGGDAGEGGGCTLADFPADRACVPATARAGEPVYLTVDATDGCLGCFTTVDACKVVVGSHIITLSIVAKACPAPGDQACPAVCALASTECRLPPLDVGTYVIKVAGEAPSTGLPPRQLVVTQTAADTSCVLPAPGTPSDVIDGSIYSKSCSDDLDCVVATDGNTCEPCKCPNLAIAKGASEALSGNYRALLSQCTPGKGGVQCAPCPPVKATCVTDPSALTGTCTLK